MGNWTEFKLSVALRDDTPKEVLHGFQEITRYRTANVPFADVLVGADYMGNVGEPYFRFSFDECMEWYKLNINSFIKTMDTSRIQEFLDYISPYVHAVDFGFHGFVYSDAREKPYLIYYDDNKLSLCQIMFKEEDE